MPNPYLDLYHEKMASFPPSMVRVLDPELEHNTRVDLLDSLDLDWIAEYAWPVPSDAAISAIVRLVSGASPPLSGGILEIGAGTGYWASLIAAHGVSVAAYDLPAESGAAWRSSTWHPVGDLPSQAHLMDVVAAAQDTALMLCYPDDGAADDSVNAEMPMSLAAFAAFTGDYIIHVGELMPESRGLTRPSPWGRTTHPDFQIALAESFHCVAAVELPSWPTARDALTIWKRTPVSIVQAESDSDGEGSEDGEDGERGDGALVFAYIPPEEQIPVTRAAPAYAFLLS